MDIAGTIADDEQILRRIAPRPDNVRELADGQHRATSFAIEPRLGERPSWSRAIITPPAELLAIESGKGRAMKGWCVAAVRAADVRDVGLDVSFEPTHEDPGHCVITPAREQFSKKVWSALAKPRASSTAMSDTSGADHASAHA